MIGMLGEFNEEIQREVSVEDTEQMITMLERLVRRRRARNASAEEIGVYEGIQREYELMRLGLWAENVAIIALNREKKRQEKDEGGAWDWLTDAIAAYPSMPTEYDRAPKANEPLVSDENQ